MLLDGGKENNKPTPFRNPQTQNKKKEQKATLMCPPRNPSLIPGLKQAPIS
jgi:hypothetical protein